MNELLNDDIKRREMGEAGKTLVSEKYGMNTVINGLVDVYKSILKN